MSVLPFPRSTEPWTPTDADWALLESESQPLEANLRQLKSEPRLRECEPRRDWAWGPITGHRLSVVLMMTVLVLGLYQLQWLLWPHGRHPHGFFAELWSWGSLLWLGAVLPGACGLAGLLSYRHATHLDEVEPIDTLVSFRIVSRGTNVEALVSTIRRCQKEMARSPLFPYVIEVVTDSNPSAAFPTDNDIVYLQVPSDYSTPNGSLFKARGLQYAVEHSSLPADAWIVHLDEETQPTSSGIKGICAMIREERDAAMPRIGQGAILYHRQWRRHPFLTLADNVRTGDDFARFHFQHRIGVTIFGLHGSYIVVKNSVEKQIGFDFGPKGSITEDAFWAMVAMQKGYRCRWVDGYLEEQSTQSVSDFVRQRRRWFQGLVKVALYAPVRLRWRICIGLNTALWAIAPFAALYTLAHFFHGFEVRGWVMLLANLSLASFGTLYLIGLRANLDEYGITSRLRRLGWFVAQLVLLPVFSLMEGAGVLAAIFKPVAGFHVVQK
jgi:egghead protein (zeste-white 4 protein)